MEPVSILIIMNNKSDPIKNKTYEKQFHGQRFIPALRRYKVCGCLALKMKVDYK
jgi:hypothetical protein